MSDSNRRPAATASAQTSAAAGFKVHPDHLDAKRGEGIRMLRRPAPDPNEPKETAVVRRGRSVHVGTDEKHMVGTDPIKGEPIYACVQEFFGPGQSVTLARSEIARLRGLRLSRGR